MGMVGGGEGAFIGEIHRAAARLDGDIELVCGAFSSDPENSARTGAHVKLAPGRAYPSWQALLDEELRLPSDQRMEFLSIVAPNDLHYSVAARSIGAGFHVFSEKPATQTLQEARLLAQLCSRTGRHYAMAHTYLGYPMVMELRERVLCGDIGRVRSLYVTYPQGWLSTPLEKLGNRQALWRTDPSRAGAGGCVGDIGVHAFILAEYASGLLVTELCADLGTSMGRQLDDEAAAFLRFDNGARGVLTATQVASGEENNLSVRVFGEVGGLHWSHVDPNALYLLRPGSTTQLRAGNNMPQLSRQAREACRTPAGHPEGLIEAFANLYRAFVIDIRASSGAVGDQSHSPAPVTTAVRGMAFIEAMVRSNAERQRWIGLDV